MVLAVVVLSVIVAKRLVQYQWHSRTALFVLITYGRRLFPISNIIGIIPKMRDSVHYAYTSVNNTEHYKENDMTTTAEKINIMQTHLDGKAVQVRQDGISNDFAVLPAWEPLLSPMPTWNWDRYEYRIKPSEPRVVYIALDINTRTGNAFYFRCDAELDLLPTEKVVKFIEVIED